MKKCVKLFYWAHGIEISRETLYKYRKENFTDFVAKIRKQLVEIQKELKIEFCNVLCYDEQYVLVMGEWMYKLTAIDSKTGHVHDFCIAKKKEFDQEFVKNFLKHIVKEYKIHTIVTDGHNIYPSVMDELEVHHKLCNFHKMQIYERLTLNMDEIPKEAKGYVKKLGRELDSLSLHTELDDIPTINNLIELYHLTTLNGHDKKKYKTIDGVLEETLLKTLRWEARVVLGIF